MASLFSSAPILNAVAYIPSNSTVRRARGFSFAPAFHFPVEFNRRSLRRSFSLLRAKSSGDEEPEEFVEELRVPIHWTEPSKALEVSEWLRVTLNKWLDDEYCREDANLEISKVASASFCKSLMEKQMEIGEILLKMAKDLESISYKESFHGAFSSANAAVDLIIRRIEQEM
ncbi:unnamed protein product [Cuscuta campestris]|uniref:Uncharacterized protein n=1 Tax=Cuscuta campestris TaxID=132261 RepID=A0A484K794_9ASTE|nr:unnamed protein product [Cuscuta campestris]